MRSVIVLSCVLGVAAPAVGQQIQWKKDWNAAVEAGKRDRKLVMVDFYTDW